MSKKTMPENQAGPINGRRLEPERFIEDISRGRREDHTQKKFVPAAMYFSLSMRNRWKMPAPKSKAKGSGRVRTHSPSTLLLNKSNIKRKPAARGRTRYT